MSTTPFSRDDALAWVSAHAASLNDSAADADAVIPQLGAAGFFRVGVPAAQGGSGGTTADAIEAIAAVAERSLIAAFVFWGQRTFIEYLLHSPNAGLRERYLPALLTGELAGATGLSNAMKFLSGIESLSISATPFGDGWRLAGNLPWVTNLRRAGFGVAAAVQPASGAAAEEAVLPAGEAEAAEAEAEAAGAGAGAGEAEPSRRSCTPGLRGGCACAHPHRRPYPEHRRHRTHCSSRGRDCGG